MPAPPFEVRPVNWTASRDRLRGVRRAVFIEEQNVPEELEWDDADERAYHVLASDDEGEPIGTGRLNPDGQIGRMAVDRTLRGGHLGRDVLQALTETARERGDAEVVLHAQRSAEGFYARLGYTVLGAPFEEAGIPHVTMFKRL